jgi:hypothetical protein
MADGVVIDANLIPDFYKDYKVKSGLVYIVVTWFTDNVGIAINGQIAAEWKNVCSADLFLSWYTDQVKLGKIRNIECRKIPREREVVKEMVNSHGFPARTGDLHYIRCAYNTDRTKYIATNNYDFFEPACKRASSQARHRAREMRQGYFCQYLHKKLGIRVGTVHHCKSDFGIS